jgi:pimeloyl-ACP methyl ester carboxylesterase
LGQAFVEMLAETWHVFAPDFRGHGLSGRVPGAYSLRDYVRDTAAFLEGVVGEPAVVYGHSMGGEVGVMLAAQQPTLLRALIVGDAPLSISHHLSEEPTHRAQNVLWHTLCGKPEPEIETALRQMAVYIPSLHTPRPAHEVLGQDSPYFTLQATSLHQLDPDMLAAVNAGPLPMLEGYEPETLLPAITCPVLLLQADPREGSALSDADVKLGLELLPSATHLRMDGLGHPLHSARPQRIAQAIGPFLASLTRAGDGFTLVDPDGFQAYRGGHRQLE